MFTGFLEEKVLGFEMSISSVGAMFAMLVVVSYGGFLFFFSEVKVIRMEYQSLKDYYNE